jgi:amino acid adenylation domain-containing protein
MIEDELQAHLEGRADELPKPLPFRNVVAQARLGVRQEEHEKFFRKMLGDVEEPTLPFGLLDVHGDGSEVEEAQQSVDGDLVRRLRERARRLGVSVASVCHVAWAQVLARVSGRDDVVFGTVLFGRLQGGEGADRALGLFINTLPARIRIGEEGVEASVRQTQLLLADLLRHEHASLALAQRCSKVQAPVPLFSAALNYRHSDGAVRARTAEAKKGIERLRTEERTNYPIALSVDDLGEGLLLTSQVKASIRAVRICEFMHTALESLVGALERTPDKTIGSIDVLPERERRLLVEDWNRTEITFAERDQCIHELFEEQVKKTPDTIAVVFEEETLSYSELNRRANRLAHYLRRLKVKPDMQVAVCAERSPEMVIGLLAVLKAGGAYVPLDPGYPAERLRYMLEDSAPAVLLTEGNLARLFDDQTPNVPVLDLSLETPEWHGQPESNPNKGDVGLRPEHLAYVIYTSGSTGKPKGVMIEHRSLVNSTLARKLVYAGLGRCLLLSPVSFDSSIAAIFGAITNAGTLLIVGQDVVRDPFLLSERIRRLQADSLLCVPSLYRQLLDCSVAQGYEGRLSRVIVGGEACPPRLVEESARHQPGASLFNEYGPTECTVWATSYCCDGYAARQSVPIGGPIANTRIYILDRHGEPAPIGVTGELYIGGENVARGYLNRPELTAERFVIDRFAGRPGARMYRTGDLGRWLSDGTIEYLGRNDEQVKIRGFRLELGEVAAQLAEHSDVREAAVMAREDQGGEKRLLAYYTSEKEVGAEVLRAHLLERLPEYMVPGIFVRLEALPRTPNGKLDSKVLPLPGAGVHPWREHEAPQGEVESALAAIWSDVLKIEHVGRNDNFFELGGHSLLASKVAIRVQHEMKINVPMRDIFSYPVLRSLAEQIVIQRLAQFDIEQLMLLASSMRTQ